MRVKLKFVLPCLFLVQVATAQTVCIDAGHPSEVGIGTKGKVHTEVSLAWKIAKGLQKALEAEGVKVVLTKSEELEKVLNRRRAEIANDAKADLLIRLHCDAASGTGFAVYYPDRTGTTKDGITGPSKDVLTKTAVAAKKFHAVYAEALKGAQKDNGLKSDLKTAVGAKQGALTGSIFSKVPVLLVEMCVLTNPADEAFIGSAEGQQKIVSAMTKATLAVVKPAATIEKARL